MVEGISGLLNINRPDWRPKYEPSKRRLTWPNGAVATLYSADDPDQLRGPEHDAFWADEIAKWRYPDSWDQLMFGLRHAGSSPPRGVATTTPRPIPLIKQLLEQDNVRVTKGSTLDNAANLAPSFIRAILERYKDTRLGRQEIDAEILDDLPGALWSRETLEACHVKDHPKLVRTVVAVDPSGASNAPKKGEKEKADDIGIVIVGKGDDGRCYVLGDWTCNLGPDGWGRRVVEAYDHFNADRIIAEANFGGGMVEHVIRSVRDTVPVRIVKTGIGKAIRAEPVAALYEQRRVRHVGVFPKLEDQMCLMAADGYVGRGSPDRCLVAGTMVATDHGDVPIERVLVGDRVLTRDGYHKVTASRLTQSAASVLTAHTEVGAITGTPDHLIWANGGWTRLDALVCDDTLITCKNDQNPSNIAASPTTPTRTRPTTMPSRSPAEALFTSICGAMRTMALRFRQATSSTTRTMTPSTIPLGISSRSPTSSMPLSTPKNCAPSLSQRLARRISSAFRALLPYGTEAMRAELGIGRTLRSSGKLLRLLSRSARSARQSFSRIMQSAFTVPESATVGWPTGSIATMSMSRAQYAAQCSGATNTSTRPQLARASVVGVSSQPESAAVYDLTIDGAHEFFANGILVHNCDALVWACSELMFKNAIASVPIVVPYITSVKTMLPGADNPMEAPTYRPA